jgi:hypothetical protein
LNGCTIQNHDGLWHYDFGESFDSVDHSYITIKHKSTLNKEFKLRKSKRILRIRRMPLDNADALALFCDGAMIDYVSWSNKGEGWNGTLHQAANADGLWSSTEEHIET